MYNSWPYFDDEMIRAAAKVLESGKVNYWTGDIHTLEDGTRVRGENGLFEYEFSRYHNCKYAISLANGSLALELALHMFNIGEGDEVITSSRTFIASASCAVMRGAVPVFADIDPLSQNISADTIRPLIKKSTKAVIAVHLAGWACELDEIKSLLEEKSKEYGHKIYLIEDCAQSLGGEYKGKKLGTVGDAGCFSFCQDKIITTGGEGGMLITNNSEAYKKAWAYKDHGKDFNRYNRDLNHPLADSAKTDAESFYTSLGTNWRMTEMQAAIGRVALKKLDPWNLLQRRKFAQILNNSFSNVKGVKTLIPPDHISHAYYKYYLWVETTSLKTGWDKNRLIEEISKKGIVCQPGSTWAIGSEETWKDVRLPGGIVKNLRMKSYLNNDLKVSRSTLMFHVHPTLTEEYIYKTVSVVSKVLKLAIA